MNLIKKEVVDYLKMIDVQLSNRMQELSELVIENNIEYVTISVLRNTLPIDIVKEMQCNVVSYLFQIDNSNS